MQTTQTDPITMEKMAPIHKHMYVSQPGPLESLKWATARLVFSTLGKSSQGIRIGYSFGFDSGTMLDYVYLNKASGRFGIGALIDRIYLDSVGWRAIRARRTLLKQLLHLDIERLRQAGERVRLLDVAAGPGRYLQELLQESGPEREDLHILCRDLSPEGLSQGRNQALIADLKTIYYEQGDAFHPEPTDKVLGGSPGIIVVSGLYELILDDDQLKQSLKRLYEVLAPGGTLYVTTQTHHPQLDFIANVLPNRNGERWIMKCRPIQFIEAWAYQAGFSRVQSQVEKVGLFAVTSCQKPL